jgi:hypothetical protein
MNIQKHQSGQIMIIFLIAFTVLLGFTALAIDGGMVYSDRRFDQNVADSAALAGAAKAMDLIKNTSYFNFSCANSSVTSAMSQAQAVAIQRAAANNFPDLTTNLNNKHGVAASCGTQLVSGFLEKYIDIKVMVTSKTQTSFAQLLFGGELVNTVEAVVRVRPPIDFYGGQAIVALDSNCSTGGITFNGNVKIDVDSGGIFSNSCITKTGASGAIESPTIQFISGTAPSCGPVCQAPTLPDPTICKTAPSTVGCIAPSKVTTLYPRLTVPAPNCSALGGPYDTDGGTIGPGRYNAITLKSNLIMNPGLYCIYGDFDPKNKDLTAYGVTIYLATGGFGGQGNGTWKMSAATTNAGGAIPGFLFLMPDSNTSNIYINGTNDATFSGIVYAPFGSIDAGGNSTILSGGDLDLQLVADKIWTHGTPDWLISYPGNNLMIRSAILDMLK